MPRAPLSLLLLAATIAASADAHAQLCGATLYSSMVLTADLVCPAGIDGIVVGDHNVRIDLNGYNITGPNSGATRGVVSSGFDAVKIVGPGLITGFFTSVRIDGGDKHEIRDIDTVAFGYGISLLNTSGSVVETSRVGFMGLGSDPGFVANANRIVGNDADSIHLYGCDTSGNEIANNRIHPITQFTPVGLFDGVSNTLIAANRIATGTVFLASSSDNLVTDNIIDNTAPSWIYAGVLLAGLPSSCARGAPVDATRNVVRGNTIIGGPVGVHMAAGSPRNKIVDNKIYDQLIAGMRFLVGSDYNDAHSNTYRHLRPAVGVVDLGIGNVWP